MYWEPLGTKPSQFHSRFALCCFFISNEVWISRFLGIHAQGLHLGPSVFTFTLMQSAVSYGAWQFSSEWHWLLLSVPFIHISSHLLINGVEWRMNKPSDAGKNTKDLWTCSAPSCHITGIDTKGMMPDMTINRRRINASLRLQDARWSWASCLHQLNAETECFSSADMLEEQQRIQCRYCEEACTMKLSVAKI